MFKETDLEKRKNAFLNEAISRFGDRIDFSKVNFINITTPVELTCTKHNVTYMQVPRSLLIGYNGCKLCYRESYTKPQDDFIAKAKEIHGNRYDYSNVIYKHSKEPVIITCKVHGDFLQSPNNHLKGQNCIKCVNDDKRIHEQRIPDYTEEESNYRRDNFISRAILKYGDIYDYSNVVYKGFDVPVIINCLKHGSFSITPHQFLREKCTGCAKCNRSSDERVEAVKQKIIAKHGDIYDFSKLNIKDKRWTLLCKKHSIEFTQLPNGVMRSSGCPKCINEKQHVGSDEFIKRANEYWKHRYTYDKTVYVRNNVPVIITCPIHGDFEKMPFDHLRRTGGCNICSLPEGEKQINSILLDMKIKFKRQHRIGNYIYRYDFLIEDINLLIEYDELHHAYEKENDALKDKLAELNGYKLVRISEKEFLNDKNIIYKKLNSYIRYIRDGNCFPSFLEFCRYYNLPGDATPEQYQKFLFKNVYNPSPL